MPQGYCPRASRYVRCRGLGLIFRTLLQLALLLTLLTVILSAWIRLAEVGIGCEPWPDCYAILNLEAEKRGITVLTERGEDMAHRGVRLAHRYIASTLGLLVLVLFIVAARQGSQRATSMLVPGGILAITVFLSLLGYYTPTRSNPLITVGNLLGGFFMLGLLWWMAQRYRGHSPLEPDKRAAYLPLAWLAFALVTGQILLGAWSSANYASGYCGDLTHCQQPWLRGSALLDGYNPLRDIELDGSGRVVRESALGALSMVHRIFALLTAGYLAWLVRVLRKEPELRRIALLLSINSICILLAGLSTILWQWPLFLVTLHNALAAGLLVASTHLLHKLTLPLQAAPPAGLRPPVSPREHH